jgi:23S rRNA (uracil1939-C5)-methyltransferase
MRATAEITELAPGGDGVTHVAIDGERRAVFVPGACPGDRAVLEVDASRRPARARVLDLLVRGEGRTDPPCPHVARCGGCDWMHLTIDAQRAAHASIVRAAIARSLGEVEVVTHAPAARLSYRTRARVHIRASGGRAIVGMHGPKSHEPAEVDACVVLDPALERARVALAPLLEGAHGRGEASLALGPLETPRRPVLDLAWSGALRAEIFARLERATLSEWAGARVFAGDVNRPAVIGDPVPWMCGADGRPLRLAPGGFAQASEAENARLARRVADVVEETGAKRVLELFAGAGNLSVLLAPERDLVTVESERDACDAARANLAARDLKARVVEADAEAYSVPHALDLVVLDPPRSGARRACEAIAARAPKHVLYVSCDPQTLGRDLAAFAPRYGVRAAETFEMFPGTSHVETVVLLQKRRS